MARSKTEKRIKFNRENILETFQKLFSEKGIRETTMDDISKAADCSKSTIYVYFKSKEEIFHYIIYGHMCELRDMIEDCIKDKDPFETCYYRICTSLAAIYERHPLYFESTMGKISIDEKDLETSEILRKIYETGERINDRMLLFFERGMGEHYLRQDLLPLPTVFTLWASLTNIIVLANNKEPYLAMRMGMEKEEFMGYSFTLLLSSIRRG